jgi:hypothetical protein
LLTEAWLFSAVKHLKTAPLIKIPKFTSAANHHDPNFYTKNHQQYESKLLSGITSAIVLATFKNPNRVCAERHSPFHHSHNCFKHQSKAQYSPNEAAHEKTHTKTPDKFVVVWRTK